jgi:hypothetical protein
MIQALIPPGKFHSYLAEEDLKSLSLPTIRVDSIIKQLIFGDSDSIIEDHIGIIWPK